LLPVLFMACGTPPKTAKGELQAAGEELAEEELAEELAAARQAEEEPAADKQAEAEFAWVVTGTQNSSGLEQEAYQESYEEMFNEVKSFIESLNVIIKSRDYSKWRDALSEEFRKEISSTKFLANVSKSTPLRKSGIVLRKPEDYFYIVVVPSRANSQVDKIEIINNNRVKAFYYREDRYLRLYELERRGDSWTIIQ
jgi:hypothetical protein